MPLDTLQNEIPSFMKIHNAIFSWHEDIMTEPLECSVGSSWSIEDCAVSCREQITHNMQNL